jgi:hypothetical protein
MAAPRRQRRSVEQYKIVSELEGTFQTLRHQPEDRGQVEETQFGQLSSHRPHGCKVHGVVGRGRGHHRCLSPVHAPAAGRLPLCAPADDPAPDALLAASLPAASWHFETAGSRSRQNRKRKSSRPIRSAISTSTLPKYGPPKAGSTCMLRSTGPANLPSYSL